MSRAACRIAVVCAVAFAAAASTEAAVRTITLRTQDGVSLTAAHYEAPRRPAAAIVLVHMLTRSKDDWQDLAPRLVDAGFAVLAVDLRGHGGSGGGSRLEDGRIDVSRMVLDVKAARGFFAGRPEIAPGKVAIVGASIGANLALLVAADDVDVRSLVLLSPGLDYQGLRTEAAIRKYGERPALLVAGANDPYARRSVRQLAAIGPGLRETHIIDAGGHGTVMLSRSPELGSLLVDWLKRTLL